MNCPYCEKDYDCADPPHGYCAVCGEDMSDQVRERDEDEAADNRRRSNELDEVK